MEVYEFEKSLLTRLEEFSSILASRETIPASAVHNEWANYLEIAVEPSGWQTLWRIPRVVCEKLSLKFPVVVMGTVEEVIYDELKAIFLVEAVQEDDVHLPEKMVVSLVELWPLKDQENNALNVDRTADCIDQLRFFYQHLWMPWDKESGDYRGDWVAKHLETRIKFYYDLKHKSMSKRLSTHVLALLAEAKHIQEQLEDLEKEIEEDEEEERDIDADGEDLLQRNKASELMKLHLRMNAIKNEIEILENPSMRKVYEVVRFSEDMETASNHSPTEAYIVAHVGTIEQHIEYLKVAKSSIEPRTVVRICDTLQGALNKCLPSSKLYLPPGKHLIKFLEYLNNGGAMAGISPVQYVDAVEADKLNAVEEKVLVTSRDNDSVLLTVDGDYCFDNLLLDCSNVRTGVLVKRGNVLFRNCCLVGDPKSTTKQAVVVFGNSTIRFERCVLKDFSTAIYSNHNCNIQLVNSTVRDCTVGLEVLQGCSVSFINSNIKHCKHYGVLLEVDDLNTANKEDCRLAINDYNQIQRKEFSFEGACVFKDNGKGNFVIFTAADLAFNNSCYMDQDVGDIGSQCEISSNVSFYDACDKQSTGITETLNNNISHADQDFKCNVKSQDTNDKDLFGSPKTPNDTSEDTFNDSRVQENSFSSLGARKAWANASTSTHSEGSLEIMENSMAVIEIDDTVIEID